LLNLTTFLRYDDTTKNVMNIELPLSRGYQIEIDFNISAKEFVEGISFNRENMNVTVES